MHVFLLTTPHYLKRRCTGSAEMIISAEERLLASLADEARGLFRASRHILRSVFIDVFSLHAE